jgi:hypothetical protein
MPKHTPNPPNEHVSRTQSANAKKLDDAATRALDYYLKPKTDKETADTPDTLFIIAPTSTPNACSPTSAKPWPRPTPWSATWHST